MIISTVSLLSDFQQEIRKVELYIKAIYTRYSIWIKTPYEEFCKSQMRDIHLACDATCWSIQHGTKAQAIANLVRVYHALAEYLMHLISEHIFDYEGTVKHLIVLNKWFQKQHDKFLNTAFEE